MASEAAPLDITADAKFRIPLPAQERLQRLFEYHPVSGWLVWKLGAHVKMGGKRAGSHAGSTGYRTVKISGCLYLEHRLIWQLVHGCCPEELDHISGDRYDNRLVNLRMADRFLNTRNKAIPTSNTSGVIGVVWNKKAKKWQAQAGGRNKRHIGYFSSKEDAAKARHHYEMAHGYHPNHGRAAA